MVDGCRLADQYRQVLILRRPPRAHHVQSWGRASGWITLQLGQMMMADLSKELGDIWRGDKVARAPKGITCAVVASSGIGERFLAQDSPFGIQRSAFRQAAEELVAVAPTVASHMLCLFNKTSH